MTYYHLLTLRRGSITVELVIASQANDVVSAARERWEISRQHDPADIVELTTHHPPENARG
jgi:hypothetical protein